MIIEILGFMSKNPKEFVLLALLLIAIVSFGCALKSSPTGTGTGTEVQEQSHQTPEQEPISEEPISGQVVPTTQKQTNDFFQLLARAESLQSFQYNLSDSELDEKYYFFVRQRIVKMQLEKPRYLDDGTVYDEVFMDRIKKVALSHCSRRFCEKPNIDKRLEVVSFSDYYQFDPVEQMYKAAKPTFVADEVLNDNDVKKFSMLYDNRYPGFIWVQSYYGFPMKLEYDIDDGNTRTLVFENMLVDSVRLGQISTPFNFTVGTKNYFTFFHYLGIYPGQPNASNTLPV
ncbi:hypothetical protein HZB03_05930 [Candidatus Woesearchaeota archaeon]|nr:hypothetical protein [Candidatus Woesearchaeota archaeon]